MRHISTYQGGAIASKLMFLDDVTGGNCWNAGLYIYLQSSISGRIQ